LAKQDRNERSGLVVPSFAFFPFYIKPVVTVGGNIGGDAAGTLVLKQREKEIEAQKAVATAPDFGRVLH